MPILQAQTTTVNLRSLKTHDGNATGGGGYSGNADSHSEFDNMVNLNDVCHCYNHNS